MIGYIVVLICFFGANTSFAQIKENMTEEELQESLKEIEELSDDIDDLSGIKNGKKRRSKPKAKKVREAPLPKGYAIQNHGLGLALGTGGMGEVAMNYKLNLHDQFMSQMKFDIGVSKGHLNNSVDTKVIDAFRYSASAIYRKLFVNGWSLGTGFSYIDSNVEYTNPISTGDDENSVQKFNFQGLFLDLDIGWQTFSRVYFTLGAKLGVNIWKSETHTNLSTTNTKRSEFFDNISDEFDHKKKTREIYNSNASSNSFYIGFGWFLIK